MKLLRVALDRKAFVRATGICLRLVRDESVAPQEAFKLGLVSVAMNRNGLVPTGMKFDLSGPRDLQIAQRLARTGFLKRLRVPRQEMAPGS